MQTVASAHGRRRRRASGAEMRRLSEDKVTNSCVRLSALTSTLCLRRQWVLNGNQVSHYVVIRPPPFTSSCQRLHRLQPSCQVWKLESNTQSTRWLYRWFISRLSLLASSASEPLNPLVWPQLSICWRCSWSDTFNETAVFSKILSWDYF